MTYGVGGEATVGFFFSSRRRHTRWPRDWSSDVCSSDLAAAPPPATSRAPASQGTGARSRQTLPPSWSVAARSEERRVGKECRSRRAGESIKNKSCEGEGQATHDRLL